MTEGRRKHGRHGSAGRERLVRELLTSMSRVRLVAREKCACRGHWLCAPCLCAAALAYARHQARRAAEIQRAPAAPEAIKTG